MSDAELLIVLADELLHPRELILDATDMPWNTADVVSLAIKLRSNPGVALRALVEEWDRLRIVREIY